LRAQVTPVLGTRADLLGTTFLMFALDADALGRAGDSNELPVDTVFVDPDRGAPGACSATRLEIEGAEACEARLAFAVVLGVAAVVLACTVCLRRCLRKRRAPDAPQEGLGEAISGPDRDNDPAPGSSSLPQLVVEVPPLWWRPEPDESRAVDRSG
jgi:hypothetical protein